MRKISRFMEMNLRGLDGVRQKGRPANTGKCDKVLTVFQISPTGGRHGSWAFLTRMAQLAALPFLTAAGTLQGQSAHKSLKILMKSRWGSDHPTKAAFPFSHGLALREAGHEV
jgi:hypothetical protein